MSARKGRLADAMKAKTQLPSGETEEATAEEQPAETPHLRAAPDPQPSAPEEPAAEATPEAEPAKKPPAKKPTKPARRDRKPTEPAPADGGGEWQPKAQVRDGRGTVDIPTPPAEETTPEPAATEPREPSTADQAQLDPLTHLRRVMENGPYQSRYVEDLPPRSGKGTYVRLPMHLQDALAGYCDRNTAPMGDFVAAVLDSFFRDIGLLPPLGEGHRPNEEMLDRLRREARRSYDY